MCRYIHYAPLMMSQKVAPRKHTSVLPRKVDKMEKLALALKKKMCASWVLPTMLVRRYHPGSTHHCLMA